MKKNTTKLALITLTIVAVIGFGSYAFAHSERGFGHHGWGHHGPGWHHGGWGGTGYDYMKKDLNDDEIEKLEKERKSFHKATQDLRRDIYTKELELKSELSKENPDKQKASKLQKEISELEAKIDQKRIDHLIEMKKINPNAGRMFMGRGGKGSGRSYGGSCWR
jgi:Spy/CpxP family protein refolding chaperone